MKEKKTKERSRIYLFKRFFPYYKKHLPTLISDLLCAALTTLCELALPMIVRKITQTASNDITGLTVKLIVVCGAIYLGLRLIDAAAYYYMSTVGHIMGTRIETDMRHDLFAHLQKLSFSYYSDTKIGTLMSRITSDLFDVTEFAHHCPEEFFIAGIKFVASFVILCTVNIPLTLIVFALLPVMMIILSKFNHKLRDGFRESRRSVGELNSQVEDTLLGIKEVKAFANENTEIEKFDKGNIKFLSIKSKVYRIMGSFNSSTRFFDGMMYIVVVIVGAFFIRGRYIDAADLMAYLLFVSTLLATVRRIVDFAEQFQRGMTGIERFVEIVDIDPEIKDSDDAVELENVRGEIELKNVTFKYSDDGRQILKSLNLHVSEGENIALVGPSGGGKTTLCALIPRFYDVTDGEVTVDGQNVKSIKLESLRNHIGVVQQDVYLFSGTVKENILYGKPGATDKEIKEAAVLAGADEFIMSLPNGYDTYVGERGVKLSGGQKQRISIARVFLKNPPILILDEATSALDNESERLVQESLERLAKGRTTVTIAHRLTTIRNADRIVVLTKNGIAEIGSHDELIEKNGLYSELYRLYSR